MRDRFSSKHAAHEKLGQLRWSWIAALVAGVLLMIVSWPQWRPNGAWPAHIDDLYWYVPLVERAWHEGHLFSWLFNSSREAGVLSLNIVFAVWVGLWPTLPVLWTLTAVVLWLQTSRSWQALALQSRLSMSESVAFMFFSVSLASVADVWIWPMAIQHIGPVLAGLWALTLALRNFPDWSIGKILALGFLLSTLRPSFTVFVGAAWMSVMLLPEASNWQRGRISAFLWATSAYTLITLATPAAGWQVTQFFSALGAPSDLTGGSRWLVGVGAWFALGCGVYFIHRFVSSRPHLLTWPNSWTGKQEIALMILLAILLLGVGRWQLSPASLIGLVISHALWPFTTANEEALRWAQIPGPLPDLVQTILGLSAALTAFRWTLRRESRVTLLVFLALILPVVAQALYLSSLSTWPWKIPWLQPMHAPSRYLIYVWPSALLIVLILGHMVLPNARWRKSIWTIFAVLNLTATAWRTAIYSSQPEREFQLSQLREIAEQIQRADKSAPGFYCSSISQVPVKISVERAARGVPEPERLFPQIEDPYHPVTYTLHRELRSRGCAGQILLNHHAGEFEVAD